MWCATSPALDGMGASIARTSTSESRSPRTPRRHAACVRGSWPPISPPASGPGAKAGPGYDSRMTMTAPKKPVFAHAPATIRLGDLEVRRLGFGAMRLPGQGRLGRARRSGARARGPAPRGRAGHQLHRHRLVLRPARRQPAHRRGAAPVSARSGDRHEARRQAPARQGLGAVLPPRGAPRRAARTDLRALRLERLDVVHLRYMARPRRCRSSSRSTR